MQKLISALLISTLIISFPVFAQKKTAEIRIQTSAQCEQCKSRIETALAYEKGVIRSNLDLDTRIVTVEYKTDKTTPDKLRQAISAVGYDAGDVPADTEAYAKLPPCCKKPDDPEHIGH